MSDRRSDTTDFNDSVIREFRANRGVVGGELADMSLLLLTTIGAWSGRPRTTPLAYHRRGHRYLVIASNGGATRHPDWFRNLERNPIVRVEVGVRAFPARATILEGSERDAVFEVIAAQAPAAARFQEKAGRTIPVIELNALAGARKVSAQPRWPHVYGGHRVQASSRVDPSAAAGHRRSGAEAADSIRIGWCGRNQPRRRPVAIAARVLRAGCPDHPWGWWSGMTSERRVCTASRLKVSGGLTFWASPGQVERRRGMGPILRAFLTRRSDSMLR
jgi:deazaflavin-dependent oxidoreductase (nitroreductase family)